MKTCRSDEGRYYMQKLVKAVECAEIISEKLNIPLGDLADIFADIPSARKQGHWNSESNRKTCSECQFEYYSNGDMFNFCPCCGSQMI